MDSCAKQASDVISCRIVTKDSLLSWQVLVISLLVLLNWHALQCIVSPPSDACAPGVGSVCPKDGKCESGSVFVIFRQ
jgi:hypothetical protein